MGITQSLRSKSTSFCFKADKNIKFTTQYTYSRTDLNKLYCVVKSSQNFVSIFFGHCRNHKKKKKHLREGSDIRREATLGLCGFLRMPVDSMFLLKCLSGCEPCIVFLIASTNVRLAGGSSSSPVGGCVHCRGEG